MSLSVVREAASFLGTIPGLGQPLTVAWHAGEPLTIKPSWYEAAFRVLAESLPSREIVHHIQTNALLITDEWIDLFVRWNVQVGVSIDGPQELHDANRVDLHARGTHSRAVEGLQRLLARDVATSVICVLSRPSLGQCDKILSFFAELGVHNLAFNVEEIESAHKSSTLDYADARASYSTFMREAINRSSKNGGPHIREYDYVARAVLSSGERPIHNSEVVAGEIISIAADGSLSTFSPELLDVTDSRYGRLSWGSVQTHTFDEMMSEPQLIKVQREITAGVLRCRSNCGYFSICGGGAPSNKLGEYGTFDVDATLACTLRHKAVVDAYLDFIGV